MRETPARLAEIVLLGVAFLMAVPPVSSTAEPYPLMPRLFFAGSAFAGSLAIALWRKAESLPFAAAKLLLFVGFGWWLHARIALG